MLAMRTARRERDHSMKAIAHPAASPRRRQDATSQRLCTLNPVVLLPGALWHERPLLPGSATAGLLVAA